MISEIKIKRGNKADVGTLVANVPGYCKDTHELFIGHSTGNKQITFPAYFSKNLATAADGLTDDYSKFADWLTFIGSTNVHLIMTPGTYVILSNLTFPANVTLVMQQGAIFSVGGGKTLTINGKLEADMYQIFTSASTVNGTSPLKEIYPEWWGAVGTGLVSDVVPFYKCLTFVRTSNCKKVIAQGKTYLFDSVVIDGERCIEGLEVVGLASKGLDGADGTIFKYTGHAICFDFKETNGTNQCGRNLFKNITFQSTQIDGTFFEYNDITLEITDDITTPNYIREIRFENCAAYGAGTTAVTANFLQGLGVFELYTDEQFQASGWKRAFSLKGCDNCTIDGRFFSNVRCIHATRSNSFGNALTIRARFFGSAIHGGVETSHFIYNENMNTVVHDPFLEDDAGIDAMIYTNYFGFKMYNPFFSVLDNDIVIFRLGAAAQDTYIYSPETTTDKSASVVYDTPSSWLSIVKATFHSLNKLVVHDPSYRCHLWFTAHPRLTVHSVYRKDTDIQKTGRLNINGARLSTFQLTPLNLECGEQLSGYSFISDVVADAAGYNGYAMRLGATTYSCVAKFLIGSDLAEGQTIKVKIRYKQEDTPTTGTFRYVIEKNGVAVANGALANSNTYTLQKFSYAISGYAAGDRICIGVYNIADKYVDISSMLFETIGGMGEIQSAAPTTGTAAVGDIVWNTVPAAGGYMGWVCITAGSPGTWKGFGLIQA